MPPRPLNWLRRSLARRHGAEASCVVVGSTGSGKSEGLLRDLVRLADRGDCAVVLLDGHGPLAVAAAGHWAARGHEPRLVFEPVDAVDRVLAWDMVPRSAAADPLRRALEDAETREELAQCLLAPRNLESLADRPWTKEWLDAAVALGLAQPGPVPLPALLDAFRPGTPAYERLLRDCGRPEVADKFRGLERLKRRNEVQYETLTGASRRLLEQVCGSEVVGLRARPGPFDWLAALRARRLVAFDGGGVRSRELKRTLFLLASVRVFHAVRRHFAAARRPLPVALVLEEAGALGLVTPFVLAALQELRKAGLAVTLITQSSLDFGDPGLFERVLSNAPRQVWYQALAPADQDLGARALANATFDPHAVHATRTRQVRAGEERVATESRGEAFGPHGGGPVGRDARRGTAFLPRYREVEEPAYKSPPLAEQEWRTALATLRVGERLVRDRRGVRRERVRLLRPPRPRGRFEARTRAAIARVRRQPLYLPPAPAVSAVVDPPTPAAAERLRAVRAGGPHPGGPKAPPSDPG